MERDKRISIKDRFKRAVGATVVATALLTNPLSSPERVASAEADSFHIPIRDTNVQINVEKTRSLIETGWPRGQHKNLDYLIEESMNRGWNPAFVVSLWIEESGAQGATNRNGVVSYADPLGCDPANPTTDIKESLNCFTKSFETFGNEDFMDLMCLYSESKTAPCAFRVNPLFYTGVTSVYQIITSP